MRIKDKSTGITYERLKCPNCGTKNIVSPEKQVTCSSCGSELNYETRKRKQSTLPIYGIISLIFDTIGLILTILDYTLFVWFGYHLGYLWIFGFLPPAIIFLIIGVIFGGVGVGKTKWGYRRDDPPKIAIIGIVIGVIIIIIGYWNWFVTIILILRGA